MTVNLLLRATDGLVLPEVLIDAFLTDGRAGPIGIAFPGRGDLLRREIIPELAFDIALGLGRHFHSLAGLMAAR